MKSKIENKYKYIAICQEPQIFNNNKIFDEEYAKRFPGSGWMFHFKRKLSIDGVHVVTGDIALKNVEQKFWNADEILIIQHDLSPSYGDILINYGAKPFLTCCYEPPLFAADFCRKLPEIARIFPNRVIYKGLFDIIPDVPGNNYPIRFPSFNIEDIMIPKDWKNRKYITMVSGNKFVADLSGRDKVVLLINRSSKLFNPHNWKKYAKFFISKTAYKIRHRKQKKTAFDIQCEENNFVEIQTKRLEAIEFFGKEQLLDLYGIGWDNLDWLGKEWKDRFDRILYRIAKGPCDDKFETMSNYKFYLCFENIFYKGAFTEKIIDCFKCGVIPVYYGVPDISDYFPKESFIDVQAYNSWESLLEELNAIDEKTAVRMIEAGQKFLRSKEAEMHTYEGHADFYINILKDYLETI